MFYAVAAATAVIRFARRSAMLLALMMLMAPQDAR